MTDRGTSNEQRATTVSDLSERELIVRIQARLPPAPPWLLIGIGDDAAVVAPERNRVDVLTVDCVVDGVHFNRAFVPPDAIGHRALAVNLSDLAAMGAAPRLALLSMALPADLPLEDFDGIADGLTTLAAQHRVQIAGGNLTRTPGPLTIDVTVAGTVKPRQALTRSGAKPGDELYVTGTVGAAAAGLGSFREVASQQSSVVSQQSAVVSPSLRSAYLYPTPRVRAGVLLSRNRVASACIDLSDGLADGVRRIAEASGVGATLDPAAIPIDPAAAEWFAARGRDPIAETLAAGDDYELLITVHPKRRRRLDTVRRQAGVTFTRIGVCTADRTITPLLPAGYGHFR